MKSGDIVFVSDKSLLSRLIQYFDHGKFSHVAICVDENNILEAQYDVKSHIVPFSYVNYEIVDLGLSKEQRKRVSEIAVSLTGYGYDYLEILSIFIRNVFDRKFKIYNSPKNYICSELVEIVLQEIGVIPNDKELRNCTPNELYKYLKQI
jgi:hypothetical protein